jgi:cystathionine beta-lyase/cystathionine gamma-synthase
MKIHSTVVHAGAKAEKTTGAVIPPIFQTSTYARLLLASTLAMTMPELAIHTRTLRRSLGRSRGLKVRL